MLLVTRLPTAQGTHAITHAGQVCDVGIIHLRDNASPTIGAAKVISSRDLSARENETL